MTDAPGGDAKVDYTFGQIAIKENYCSFEQVKECLDIQNKLRGIGIEPKKLGEILIEKGYLKPEQAVAIGRLQVQGMSTQRIQIPGYEILSRIGQGAMGAVFKARQVSMDRIVAIKVLSGKYSKDRAFVDRFVREARAVARLNHENVISGFDVGESNGVHYFVMEFIDGTPVSSLLRKQGRVDERRCLEIAQQIARALAHAHKHGIVHRDVKPENIMITSGGVAKLCDLGLAKQAKEDAGVTMDGMSVGTPNYISPEQARGEERIDIRTDIYSLGASLYHMATGTTPFTGANPMVVMTKHVTEFPEPPRKRFAGLSEGFNNLVLKMMEKRREDRPQTPDALIADIELLLRGGVVPAVRVAAPIARPEPVVVRPKTEVGHKPITHVPRFYPSRTSSSSMPIFIGVGVLAVVGIAFILASAGGSTPDPGGSGYKPPAPPAPPPPETGRNEEEEVQKELSSFRSYVDSRIVNPSIPDRFTAPFSQIQERIEHYKARSMFVAQQAWEEELPRYTEKVNSLITTRIWVDIEKKAREHYEANRYAKAIEELNRLEEVYKWFRKGERPRMTEAGKAHAELLRKINRELSEAYVTQKRLADEAFSDPARRDEAYRLLDGLAASAPPEQRAEIRSTRRAYLESEVSALLSGPSTPEGLRKAQERLRQLKALHPGDAEVNQYLDRVVGDLKEREKKLLSGAASQAAVAYVNGFQPKFAGALKQRDLGAMRRSFHAILFSAEYAAVRPVFLSQDKDAGLLGSYLDPVRAAPFADLDGVIALAQAGAQRDGQEAVRDFHLDLRETALLESLVEEAVKGAELANRDPGKFRTGYSASLKNAVSVAPAPRRPGEGVALSMTFRQGAGTAVQTITLEPRAGGITEEDIVNLARRAAPSDALLPVKAFLLHYHAGQMAEAKVWWDQMTAPELKFGMERYADRIRTVASAADEDSARKLYETAVDLYVRKRDVAGALKMFRECLEKYSGTEYMKVRTTVGKSRLELIQERLNAGGGGPKGQAPGPAPA